MKSLITAASLGIIAFAAPAIAQVQTTAPTGVYANLGYSNLGPGDAKLDAIQGRLGYRFNNWLGLEGELAGGLGSDKVNVAPGLDGKVKLQHQEAVYGVGFLPLTPQWDLIGRVGYGNTKLKTSAAGLSDTDNEQSWNFGAGAQYHFDDKNGVRADYTRQEYEHNGNADVWSVAYSRRF
jgi:predicted porin